MSNSGHLIPLAAEQLLARAREITGIDIVDQQAEEPLKILVNAYNTDSQLRADGASAMQEFLLRILCNRLRMQRDWMAHPEIADEQINRPLIIYGLARSGTTKTQKLLSSSGDFNFLPYWQTFNPSLFSGDKNEDVQPRIDQAHAFTQWLADIAPDTLLAHPAETFEPEEDSLLSNHFLLTPVYYQFAEIPSYLQWLSTQDFTWYYQQLRDWLKYLQWQGLASGEKRWLLKSPMYYGTEPLLLNVFPDADLVMTHRHPKSTVTSSCKFLQAMLPAYSDIRPDPRVTMQLAAAQMNAHMDIREQTNLRVLDINSVDASGDVGSLMRRIYDFAEMQLSDASLQRIIDCDARNPRHKYGKFHYSLEEFGLSQDDIAREFERYIALIDNLTI